MNWIDFLAPEPEMTSSTDGNLEKDVEIQRIPFTMTFQGEQHQKSCWAFLIGRPVHRLMSFKSN